MGAPTRKQAAMHLGGRKYCAGIFFVAGMAMLAFAFPNAGLGCWPQCGFNARHNLFNPSEYILNPSNVGGLTLQWEFVAGNGTGIVPLAGPALADGVLHVASHAQTKLESVVNTCHQIAASELRSQSGRLAASIEQSAPQK